MENPVLQVARRQFDHHQLALELVAGDLAQAGSRVLDRRETFLHREANERAWLIVAEPLPAMAGRQ